MVRVFARLVAAVLWVSPLSVSATPHLYAEPIDNEGLRAEVRQATGLPEFELFSLTVPAEPGRMTLTVPSRAGSLSWTLWPHSNRAQGYEVRVYLTEDEWVPHEPSPVGTLRGTLSNSPEDHVAASLRDGQLTIRSWDQESVWVFESAALKGIASDAYLLYRRSGHDLECGAYCGVPDRIRQSVPSSADIERGAAYFAQVGCDADYEYFQTLGYSLSAVEARINDVINCVNVVYEPTSIAHEITTLIIRTTEEDPYPTPPSDSGQTYLNQLRQSFISEWYVNQANVDRDLAFLFSGKTDIGLGGQATNPGICNEFQSYGVAVGIGDDPDLDCEWALVAHEIGHLWDADHCNPGCPSNIMNSTAPCGGVFTMESISTIIAHRGMVDCYSDSQDSLGSTPLPFFDEFDSATIDTGLWTGVEDASSEDVVNGPPSPPFALRLDGQDRVRSARMDTTGTAVTVSYAWKRADPGDTPEVGDDLIVEYYSRFNGWQLVHIHEGTGLPDTSFTSESLQLPCDAAHEEFRIGFRNESTSPDSDDFWVDDISVTAVAIAPTEVSLLSPSDGAVEVAIDQLLQWSEACPAASYRLQVDDDPAFADPEIDIVLEDTRYSLAANPLSVASSYCWKVEAVNATGSVLSSTSIFATAGFAPGPCPGDTDSDRRVDFDDLNNVFAEWGTDGSNGGDVAPAPSGDGVVNFMDLELVLEEFGTICH